MALQYDVNDSEWEEVRFINGYALFMGYLMMGVRGLGLLVITWTTVVLLGGFVSNLENNDFWCLTAITLIQTAGVFNFLLTEKLSDMVHLWWGLLGAAVGTVIKGKREGTFKEDDDDISTRRLLLALSVSAIQGVVLFIILCPVAILYVFGLGISAGASLWRLIKHDFGNDGGDNKKPALQVLYSLAVAQGVLFGYKIVHAFAAKTGLVKLVYNQLEKQVHEGLVAEYLEETVAGCEKDPSFATGRNLVTYGVDLMMAAKPNEGFIAGIKVLGGAIKYSKDKRFGRKVLAKHLLLTNRSSDSSNAIIQRLLETVGPRSPYNREIKKRVLRILDIIAPCILLEQFPRAIECLCSVVDASEECRGYDDRFKDYERVELLQDYERYYIKFELGSPDSFLDTLEEKVRELLCQCLQWKRKKVENEGEENIKRGFDRLLIKAVNLIQKLVAAEDNGWILRNCISNTTLHKIAMLPLKLHNRENHDRCRVYDKSQLHVIEQCLVLTERLLVALTKTSSPPLLPTTATPVDEGRRQGIRSEEIEEEVEQGEEQLHVLLSMDGSALGSTIKHTITHSIENTVKCILDCLDCGLTQKSQAIQILLHLSLDMSIIVEDSESSRRLRWILLLIICSTRDHYEYCMVPSLTYRNNNCCDFDGIRRLAGEKLSEMMLGHKDGELPSEERARELESIRLALGDLVSASCADAEDISTRIHAIEIMQELCQRLRYCICYSEVVEEFLVGANTEETLFRWESITAKNPEWARHVEMGDVPQDNQAGCIDTQQRLRKALASLCYYGYMHSNFTMTSAFHEIARKTCEEKGKSIRDFRVFICDQSISE